MDGTLDVQCGTYGWVITPPKADFSGCGGSSDVTFTSDQAKDAIGKFCSDDAATVMHPNPDVSRLFIQDEYKFHDPPAFRWYQYDGVSITIQAYFAVDNDAFKGMECDHPDVLNNFTVASYKDGCVSMLTQTVDNCKCTPWLLPSPRPSTCQ